MKNYKVVLFLTLTFLCTSSFAQTPKKPEFIIKAYHKMINKKGKQINIAYAAPLLEVTDTALVFGPIFTKNGRINDMIIPYHKISKIVVEKNRSNAIFGAVAVGAITGNIIYALSIDNVWLAIGAGVVGCVVVIPIVLTTISALVRPPKFKTTDINYHFLKDKLSPFLYKFNSETQP